MAADGHDLSADAMFDALQVHNANRLILASMAMSDSLPITTDRHEASIIGFRANLMALAGFRANLLALGDIAVNEVRRRYGDRHVRVPIKDRKLTVTGEEHQLELRAFNLLRDPVRAREKIRDTCIAIEAEHAHPVFATIRGTDDNFALLFWVFGRNTTNHALAHYDASIGKLVPSMCPAWRKLIAKKMMELDPAADEVACSRAWVVRELIDMCKSPLTGLSGDKGSVTVLDSNGIVWEPCSHVLECSSDKLATVRAWIDKQGYANIDVDMAGLADETIHDARARVAINDDE